MMKNERKGGASVLWALLLAPLIVAAAPQAMYLKAGRIVNVDGRRMNLYCRGHGSPTVVLESGIEEWAPEWALVQPALSATTRTCSYDRAGYGFSDPGPIPRTSDRSADDLHALLHDAGERGPFILVGHSFGGVIVRSFASRYASDVAGLVLDDSENEEFNFSLAPPSNVDAYIKSEQDALDKCARGVSARAQCFSLMFRGLPEARFSNALNAMLSEQASRPVVYETAASELSNFMESGLQHTLAQRRSLGAIPVLVLTAGHHTGLPPVLELRWRLFARDFLGLSTDSRQIVVAQSGHNIELDDPQAVIAAVKEEVAQTRTSRR